ncbi:RidA family protein [Actinomadura sp. NAK00032]|uniref:RidA family protein n=1 Tax=Actinomadura sp. NAK00032 TaxID=2742128 RepID=UPI0015907274|nr:RidA family protein [Actinomadura sp. NAK00032]QKW37511.1 RidA family protein [Actinomadura sp. NAK00032]
MPISITNPSTLHDPVGFGYSHVARVGSGELMLIAGQYASDREGHVVSADFAEQVDQALANLGAALESADLRYRDVAGLRTFVVDHDPGKLAVIAAAVRRIWGDQPPTQTLLGVAALALPDMRFEVDAIAVCS